MQRQALQSPSHPRTYFVPELNHQGRLWNLGFRRVQAEVPGGGVCVPLSCGQTILANKIQQVKTITALLALGGFQGSLGR